MSTSASKSSSFWARQPKKVCRAGMSCRDAKAITHGRSSEATSTNDSVALVQKDFPSSNPCCASTGDGASTLLMHYSINTSKSIHYLPGLKIYHDTRTATSLIRDGEASKINSVLCHQRQPEVQSVWDLMSGAMDLPTEPGRMATMIEEAAIMVAIVDHLELAILPRGMTIEERHLYQSAADSQHIEIETVANDSYLQ